MDTEYIKQEEFDPAKFYPIDSGFSVYTRANYNTLEQSEQARAYLKNINLLLQIAIQYNPSGKIGGNWGIWKETESKKWYIKINEHPQLDSVFETGEVANKAADIFNHRNI